MFRRPPAKIPFPPLSGPPKSVLQCHYLSTTLSRTPTRMSINNPLGRRGLMRRPQERCERPRSAAALCPSPPAKERLAAAPGTAAAPRLGLSLEKPHGFGTNAAYPRLNK